MITDCFELLQEPRRPWLDAEALKSKFLALSSEVHPDRFHQAPECEKESATQRYAAVNAAYLTLKEPKDRLLHLLTLERGERPSDIQKIPPGTMDLFVEIGQACRDVDAFLKEKGEISSPLLKVASLRKAIEWMDRLNALQRQVNQKRDEFLAELPALNRCWELLPHQPTPTLEARLAGLPLERLEQIYRGLSYVARWTEQIQQRVAELA